MAALGVGVKAPDFELFGTPDLAFRLSTALGKSKFTVLAFFPAAFSSVCTEELNLYQELLDEFTRRGAQIVAISVDGKHAQRGFAKANGLTFPVLSDFHPHGAVAQQYGVLGEDGAAERALFIVDSGGSIRFSHVSQRGKNPGADILLDALDGMQ